MFMAGSERSELWSWAGLCKKRGHLFLISLPIFWVVWKKKNVRAFESIETNFTKIRDR